MDGQRIRRLLILLLTFSLVAGCNFPSSQEDSTPDSPATAAARTLQVVFTNVASGTEIPIEEAPPVSNTETGESTPAYADSDCINKAVFVDDITVRDNMQIERGASFVKIWRLRNDGTCIWNHSYCLAFIGGARMSAPAKSDLSQVIQPGQTIDLSIDLTAPDSTGTYQGFWRLQSDKGEFFGIGSSGDQSFWVKINVISSLTVTPTLVSTPSVTPPSSPDPVETPTPTISPEPTPAIHFQGANSLTVDQSIDLDSGEISPQSGADLSLLETTPEEPSLVPQNSALFSLYSSGSNSPNRNDCQNSSLTEDPISITGLAVDDIICYSTDVGRFGYLTITALNTSVDFAITTWGP